MGIKGTLKGITATAMVLLGGTASLAARRRDA
jgi:hypothetical protein